MKKIVSVFLIIAVLAIAMQATSCATHKSHSKKKCNCPNGF
ncbi:MAG: hypothetical protein WCO54_02530 [Bacteroidota bacterium]